MSSPADHFEGWVGLSPECVEGNLVRQEFKPKAFEDDDIDIEITHCGIDGSDLHVLRSGWGPTDYPIVAGHEIVGNVIRAGKKVTGISVGDRVGIGGQSGSCLRPDCLSCARGLEQHCRSMVFTYGGRWPSGEKSHGGFARHWRGDARFAVKIPAALPSSAAAPLLCGGATMYAALKQHGVGPGARVGIAGLGGLGHLGVLVAKALGAAQVVAISRTRAKAADAAALGADALVATADEGWAAEHAGALDVVVNTVSSPEMPLDGYLALLGVDGTFVQVGAPDEALPRWHAFAIIAKRVRICGSLLGSRAEMREMLELAVEKGIRPWVVDRHMSEVNQAMGEFREGKARYRIVLHN